MDFYFTVGTKSIFSSKVSVGDFRCKIKVSSSLVNLLQPIKNVERNKIFVLFCVLKCIFHKFRCFSGTSLAMVITAATKDCKLISYSKRAVHLVSE